MRRNLIHQVLLSIVLASLSACFALPTTTSESASPAMGPSPYGLCSASWQCDDMISTYAELPSVHVSFIINTFGAIDNCPCFNKMVNALGDKLGSVEFIMLNQVCVRNNRCEPYEFLYGETVQSINDKLIDGDPVFRDRYLAYSQQVQEYYVSKLPSQTRCLINPLLEATQTNDAGSVIIGYSQQVFGQRCEYIWNPLNGVGIAGNLLELHGSAPVYYGGTGTVYNNDGTVLKTSQAVANLKKYTSGSYSTGFAYYWTPEDNCLPHGSPFIDPRERTECTTAAQFESIVGIIKQALQ